MTGLFESPATAQTFQSCLSTILVEPGEIEIETISVQQVEVIMDHSTMAKKFDQHNDSTSEISDPHKIELARVGIVWF